MSEHDTSTPKSQRLSTDQQKNRIAMQGLESRLTSLEEQLAVVNKGMKTMQGDLKRLTTLLSGTEKFDAEMASFRLEVGKMIEKRQKMAVKQQDDRISMLVKDLNEMGSNLSGLKHISTTLTQIKKEIKTLKDDDDQQAASLVEKERLIEEIHKQYLENQETMAAYKMERTREGKTLVELTTEVATLRKRSDDQRALLDQARDALKKTTAKLDEFLAEDEKRTASYRSLIDELKLTEYEHEKTWREWLNRYDLVNKTAIELENKLNALDDAQRKAKQSQKGLDDATLRIERRINEIAEMQRLAEERAHQDWEGYQSEEQKRWKTYTVSNDEALSELRRQMDAIKKNLSSLEDYSRQNVDTMRMLSEETQKKLQGFLELYHEWAAVNADILNRARPR